METRGFGETGLEVSVLGFGGAPIGVLETEQRQVERILNLLLDEGVNLVDTAAAYRGSEEAIGEAISHRRDEFVLVSKCGQAFDDLDGDAWSETVIMQTVDRSLKRLRTEYLDVMLLHTCDRETLERGEALGALAKAREAGKVRFVGYSGDNQTAAWAAGQDDVAVIQTSINICDQVNIDQVLPITETRGLGVMVKRPIANAAWKDLDDQPGFYAQYAETYTERLAQMNVRPADLGVDGDEQEAWPGLALRFTLSQPGVHTAIVGTTDEGHIRANLAAAAEGPLDQDAVATLRMAFREGQQRAGQEWPGET